MSKSVYLVTLAAGPAHSVEADAVLVGSEGAAVTLSVGGEVVGQFYGVESMLKRPAKSEPEQVVSVGEPIQCTFGASSFFSSPASPLIEAIESTARLVGDLESKDGASRHPGRESVHSDLRRQLDVLLAEQRGQLCLPAGSARPR